MEMELFMARHRRDAKKKKKKKNFSSEKMAARGQAGNDASPAGAAAAPPSRDPGLRCHDCLYFWPDASVIASHSLSIGLYLLEPPPFPSLPFPASSAAGLIK